MKSAPFIPTRDLIIFPGIITPIFIGRNKSSKTLEKAMLEDDKLLLFMQKNKDIENPKLPEEINKVGVLVKILQTVKMPDGTIKVLVEGSLKVKFLELLDKDEVYMASYEELYPEIADENSVEALKRRLLITFEKYVRITNRVSPELILNLKNISSAVKVFDLIASNIIVDTDIKQKLLEMESFEELGHKLIEILNSELEIIGLEKKIDVKIKSNMNSTQKNYYLKEKLKVIKEELGEEGKIDDEINELKERVESLKAIKDIKEKISKEIKKLSKMSPYSSESSVIRNYVEFLLDFPWSKTTKDILDIKKANDILEEDHYGLDDVKERILEFLAVKKLNKNMKGSILCLVGPPGVGKTSLAKSIARSMGRKFARISLGGLRDEAEIRGHRRTYVGAMAGRIINEIKLVGTKNPLILLDEIDKMATDFRGDPSSALLEVLDHEQNKDFIDHYVDMPVDLSNVFFIATANDLGSVPGPLRDRMEIITISSYTEFEKLNIAKKYLVSKSKIENGLKKIDVKVSDEAILKIINEYTREAGVRTLKRTLDSVFRKVAKEVVETDKKKVAISVKNLKKYLGNVKFRPDKMREKIGKIGVVNGLAWTSVGGTTLEVQSAKTTGKGKITLTGKLGDVMKESAHVALTYVKTQSNNYGIDPKFYDKNDLHLHFPEGAVPKDGPSAGITIATAIISIIADKPVRHDVAMTGEVTITGEVLAVGGIKEKVIGAHRVGIREVVLPYDNRLDTEELPKEIVKDMKFYFAKSYDDVAEIVFWKEWEKG